MCVCVQLQHAYRHVDAIASVIAELDGDIVHLCEVQSCTELQALLARPQLSNKGYTHYMVKVTTTTKKKKDLITSS